MGAVAEASGESLESVAVYLREHELVFATWCWRGVVFCILQRTQPGRFLAGWDREGRLSFRVKISLPSRPSSFLVNTRKFFVIEYFLQLPYDSDLQWHRVSGKSTFTKFHKAVKVCVLI